jgi:hypothetical protein
MRAEVNLSAPAGPSFKAPMPDPAHSATDDGASIGPTHYSLSLKAGKSRQALTITRPNAAGIDIGSASH